MNINTLITAAQRPEIYTPGTASMWQDAYISTQLLDIHLSQDIDLASRKETTIASTVDWILDTVPGQPLEILDLGCGPGLYTEKMARRGHIVTGMDFSANSIGYAREVARDKGLDITYRQQNYLELADENTYDLILMIFTDFGVLTPDQRARLLANVYRALKPGGTFLFDVLNEHASQQESPAREYELLPQGFWRNSPYLALSQSYYYEEEQVCLSQHIIIDDITGMAVYRFWIHTFSHGQLASLLTQAGFGASRCYENIIPDSGLSQADNVTFCVATK